MLGYSVDTCFNPVEAMDLLNVYPDKYDLVITDVFMPKMTGIEFYKRVIPYKRNISVLNSKVFHSDYY